jgi:hypothetical protein
MAIKVAASVLYLKHLDHWLITADQPVTENKQTMNIT